MNMHGNTMEIPWKYMKTGRDYLRINLEFHEFFIGCRFKEDLSGKRSGDAARNALGKLVEKCQLAQRQLETELCALQGICCEVGARLQMGLGAPFPPVFRLQMGFEAPFPPGFQGYLQGNCAELWVKGSCRAPKARS